jgi:SAM-dependent methyltransferase
MVLEVGSWNVNGSVRELFQSCEYLGVDIAPGPGVDLVARGEALALPTASFDVVISCECFEHNPRWLETFLNMERMLKPGGLFVFTCSGIGHREHGTPRTSPSLSAATAAGADGDYYHNLSKRDFENRIALSSLFANYAFFDNHYAQDLYFVGVKSSATLEPGIATRIAALRSPVRRIRLDKPVTRVFALSTHGKWWLKRGITALLGEPRYHDIMHFIHADRPARKRKGRANATAGRQ